jgi:hypothetical protein
MSRLSDLKTIYPELYNELKQKQQELSREELIEYVRKLAAKYQKINDELGGIGMLNKYDNYKSLGKQLENLKNIKQDILSGNYKHNSFNTEYPNLSISFYDDFDISIDKNGIISSTNNKFRNKDITKLTSSEFDELINIGEKSYNKAIDKITSLFKRAEITPVLYSVLLNVQKPLVKDFEGKTFVNQVNEEGAQYEASRLTNKAAKSGQYDSVIFKNIRDPYLSDNYGIFEPEQIYILGGEEDLQGFKNFVSNKFEPTTPVSNPVKNDLLNILEEIQRDIDEDSDNLDFPVVNAGEFSGYPNIQKYLNSEFGIEQREYQYFKAIAPI